MTGPIRVVVVGGGLAGMAAALRLADAGRAVTLLERHTYLGGRASSFDRGALRVDSGQHVILRCYTSYRTMLARVGVEHLVPIQDRLEIPVLGPAGVTDRIRRGRHGPPPLHLLPALLGYRALPLRDTVLAARAAAALWAVDPDDPRNDLLGFGDWLCEQGQREPARTMLWDLFIRPTLNIDADQASLSLAAKVLRTGLLDGVGNGDVGVPTVPLSDLHDTPVRALFARLGIQVRTGARVTALHPRGDGFLAQLDSRPAGSREQVDADEVVLAVPHPQAAALVPQQAAPDRGRWAELGSSPIVNSHFLFDRKVFGPTFAAAPGSPVQWVFDRSRAAGIQTGQYLVTSVSAAGDQVTEPTAEICRQHLATLADLLPAVGRARVLDSFVLREPHATFSQQPGTARLRPTSRTQHPHLALAGAWTATGWPDTLEGAVRSGLAAAAALLGRASTSVGTPVRDEPAGAPEPAHPMEREAMSS